LRKKGGVKPSKKREEKGKKRRRLLAPRSGGGVELSQRSRKGEKRTTSLFPLKRKASQNKNKKAGMDFIPILDQEGPLLHFSSLRKKRRRSRQRVK